MSSGDKFDLTALSSDALDQFERWAKMLDILKDLSDLSTDAELKQFFALLQPALAAAQTQAEAAAGRPLTEMTQNEIKTVYATAFVSVASDAAREVWGADIGALFDGRRSQ